MLMIKCRLVTQYLTPTCCTMFFSCLFVSYYSDMFQFQFLAIFMKLTSALICAPYVLTYFVESILR